MFIIRTALQETAGAMGWVFAVGDEAQNSPQHL